MRDLFVTLLDDHNRRGHALLTTLLYLYCPKAAWWWDGGINPRLEEAAPDPTWIALEDMASGVTLHAGLVERGFDTTLQEAYRYISAVGEFRNLHTHVVAPETTAFFDEVFTRQAYDFQLRDKVNRVFGGWDGFYQYLRTHAFLFEDWARGMNFDPPKTSVEQVTLSLHWTGTSWQSDAIHWPAWLWRDRGPSEHVSALVPAGSPEEHTLAYVFLFTLLSKADRVEGSWKGNPLTFALDPKAGRVVPFEAPAPERTILKSMETFYRQSVRQEPYLPLGALTTPSRCRSCGFRDFCYDDGGTLRDDVF